MTERPSKALLWGLLAMGSYYLLMSHRSDVLVPPDASGGDDSGNLPPPAEPVTLLQDIKDTIVTAVTGQSLGERLNNPGNLRPGSPWQGLAAVQSDPRYLEFDTWQMGMRAMAYLLRISYCRRLGFCRIDQIVQRYAPSADNNLVGPYVADVSARLGVDAGTALDLEDDSILTSLMDAMIHHEQGRNIWGTDGIAAGIALLQGA
jgi:hypothetical protein